MRPQFNHAFSGAPWTRDDCSVNVRYFKWFSLKTYEDATRIADRRSFVMLTHKPLRDWKIQADIDDKGLDAGWQKVDFDDKSWGKTDVAVDTWSAIGYHDYFGTMWYRTADQTPAAPKDKKVYLWIAATDGPVRVFVNGKHVPFDNDDGESHDEATGYCQPFSFDITSVIEPGQQNVIALRCTRAVPPNEIGTGGLLGPVAIYRQN